MTDWPYIVDERVPSNCPGIILEAPTPVDNRDLSLDGRDPHVEWHIRNAGWWRP